MAESPGYYEEEDLARLYVLYRPTYSKELFQYIVGYYEDCRGPHCNYQLAVDVGCGSGQSTFPLAEYFHRVIGCDISRQQISHAPSGIDRVQFKICSSERLAYLETNSVDLLTAASSFHFFNQDMLNKEATRVLKPGGVLAIYTYVIDMSDDKEGKQLYYRMIEEFLERYGHMPVNDVMAMCEEYTFPFPERKRFYEEEELARLYLLYRPTYPKELFQYIVDYYQDGRGPNCNYQLAVDVGCGNGQSTPPLAEYFHRVIGCDISSQQISHAPSNVDRVEFKVCTSEHLSFLEANSVDLLTAASAFHFFDKDLFYKEASRVLKPGGVIAFYTCVLDMFVAKEGQTLFNDMIEEFLRNYGHIPAKDYLAMCNDYTLPFPKWKRISCDPSLCHRQKWSLSRLLGFITSLHAWSKYIKQNPQSNYLEQVEERFAQLYNCKGNTDDPLIDVKFPVHLIIGRKPITESENRCIHYPSLLN